MAAPDTQSQVLEELRTLAEAAGTSQVQCNKVTRELQSERLLREALEQQLVAAKQEATHMLHIVNKVHADIKQEADVIQLYQCTLEELSTLQQQYLEAQHAHQDEVLELQKQLDRAKTDAEAVLRELRVQRDAEAAEVQRLTATLQQTEEAHRQQAATAQERYTSHIRSLEDYKNSVLAEKREAEERWAKERAALQAQVASASATPNSRPGEAAHSHRGPMPALVAGLRPAPQAMPLGPSSATGAHMPGGISPQPVAAAAGHKLQGYSGRWNLQQNQQGAVLMQAAGLPGWQPVAAHAPAAGLAQQPQPGQQQPHPLEPPAKRIALNQAAAPVAGHEPGGPHRGARP